MSDETNTPPPSAVQALMQKISGLAIGIAASALIGLVIVQGWQVFARYVLNNSPSWTEPVTLLLLATTMSLGAAAGVHTRRHFGFFLLHDHVRPAIRQAIDVLVALIIAAIGLVIAYWAAILLVDGLDIRIAGANLPQSINYLPLSLGGALMALFAINQLVLSLSLAPEPQPHGPGAAAAPAAAQEGDL